MNEPQSETPEADAHESECVKSYDIALTTLRTELADALTDRARFEQGVESLTAQLDALRAERDETREQLKISNDPDYSVLVYQELDALRSEVERLTRINEIEKEAASPIEVYGGKHYQ